MNIRPAIQEDAQAIANVAFEAVTPHKANDFNDEGWEHFVSISGTAATLRRLHSSDYLILCYTVDGELLGVITVYNNQKIDQLFVLPKARNQGIAQKLWFEAKYICLKQGNPGNFWVRSSQLAVPIYQKFGFYKVGEREVVKGISFQVMQLVVSA